MLKPAQSVQVYPRGFLGKPIEKTDEPLQLAARSPNLMFGFQLVGATKKSGSPEIDELIHNYLSQPRYAERFDCFKTIITQILTVFGTNRFGQWLFMQRESPKYSSLHERFLIDTCQYLNGENRKLSIYNWEGMFKHVFSPGQESYGMRVTETNTPLKLNESDSIVALRLFKEFESITMGNVALLWLSQPNGLDDLVSTLGILFGSSHD